MIRLHDYWRSSASYRVRIGLGLAGLTWESLPVDLVAGAQRDAAHLDRNPQGLVPVLEMDGLSLIQSLAILEYLEETRQIGILPGDAAERARIRALAHAVAMEIHPVCNLRVARHATEASDGAITMQGWMQRFITPGLAALEALVDDGLYCVGDRLTLADICLVPQLYNAERWGVDMSDMPKLQRIGAHLSSLPAVSAAHPDRTPQ